MRVSWYGHACFRLEGAGVSVITDPYTPEPAGLDPVTDTADIDALTVHVLAPLLDPLVAP